eukprot:ANDGO_01645.mRNA.1 Farnesyl diphosphate synthase
MSGQAVQDKQVFEASWNEFAKEILADLDHYDHVPAETVEYFRCLLEHSCVGGKMNRGLAVVSAARSLVGRDLTAKEIHQSCVLGWCIELLQAFFLVADDYMDASITRRGLPCWYRMPGVGVAAVNDSIILESHIYFLLKKHLRDHAHYIDIVEIFHQVAYMTELGQHFDLTTTPPGATSIDWSRYTLDRYRRIVKYKTAYYSFVLPVQVAMLQVGKANAENLATTERILCLMGEYFQIQDDYLDAYADPEVLGKIGTDIQDAKCSWLVVTALGMATDAQKQILFENYGKHDDKCIDIVKALYRELDLETIYKKYEEDVYGVLCADIKAVHDLPHDIFFFLLHKIYKRQK